MELKRNSLYWLYLTGFFLILALPLLNLPPWFSPPDWGKTIVFRIVLSILIFVFIYDILSKKQFSIKTSLPFWLLVSLFGIYFLATIFSLDRNFSLWGSPYRSGGFVNLAFYIILAVLAFLILRDRDWQKIWGFAILIGVLVSIIAIFQQFNILNKIFIPRATQLSSTIGGPTVLGMYLLLLSFPALSLGLGEKNKKRGLYLLSFFLFIYIIFLTGSQGSYLGLGLGLVWFIFFYPKKLFRLKILFAILLVLGLFFIYFLKTNQDLFPKQNFLIQALTSWKIDESRISAWKVSLKALKDRPVLGYGPENFSIGFDRYYDPSLPGIQKDPTATTYTSWWDRAHNFVFDISLTAGIPALIIYISLFVILFWQLEKIKNKNSDKALSTHGIQAAFVGYLAAIFFNFDNFSTYSISFLLIGYSLFLISGDLPDKDFSFEVRGKNIILLVVFVGLSCFIWFFNIKPLAINKEIRISKSFLNNTACKEALSTIDKALNYHSFLDNYARLGYIDIANECISKGTEKTQLALAEKSIELLKDNTKIEPTYTRNWILLGNYTNILIEKGRKDLKDEASDYFQKAEELSPKRQEIFIGWTKTYFLADDYNKAKEKAQECIDQNPNLGDCWWLMALINIHLNKNEEAKEDIKTSGQKGYPVAEDALLQLAKAYAETKNYQELVWIYKSLMEPNSSNYQYHFSLAQVYKEIGDFENARIEALITLGLLPSAKNEIDQFLKDLK